jgi:hypothetical protein
MRTLFAALCALLLALSPAAAQSSLSTYDAVRAGLLAVWAEMPLSFRNASIVEGSVAGYGNYQPAASTRFSSGAPIHVYVETFGYGWRSNDDGTFSVLLDVDLSLRNAEGKVVASEERFLSTDLRSRSQNLETFLTFDATLTDFAAGDYSLEFTVRDQTSGKSGSFSLPVTLAPAG